ncbi:energy-coupling factor ABC transporter permease [Methanimicrococcus blatticola]|uniref:Putative cobalt transport protein CbiM n=1 Tax=Methanimicrococcus blatticola TaxID=91560 RepID=A0A484F7B6_9EURY|nr:energy-coupling factor ABC transporter permease [Methanimicrococcus blatticola]MBZ3934945.1 energy-coupling factor ABC transporter permease [Methanimicrococcus blatticola]MCC2508956.1 energy-coupling factor ABC transporter permease [Methanimicrococcus blatticola]TDQ71015.1 cobalt/nickel transport system permease protein [Methanimicrococcus blatticola]
MHIMEGMLPVGWAAFWWGLTAIILVAGIIQLNKVVRKNREVLPLLAVSGAFIFVLSSLKLPSVTGSSSHPTGTGLSSFTFGPLITAVLSAIVLLFQALLLAHGGITTLGANCFSMGFFGPLLAYALYKALQKTKLNIYYTVFLAAFVADLGTYVVTALQLALASVMNSPLAISALIENFSGFLSASAGFLGVFAVTQVPLAILEGLIIVVAFKYIAKLKGDFLLKTDAISEEQLTKINS